MTFIKTHLISLICGVLGIGFIVVTVLGMTGSTIEAEMKKHTSAAGSIDSLKRDPKNPECIRVEKDRSKRFQDAFNETLAVATKINTRQPLRDDVFPRTSVESKRFKFKEDYEAAMKKLPNVLQAAGLPTAADIEEENQNVADLQALELEKIESGVTAPAVTVPPSRKVRTPPRRESPRVLGPTGRGDSRRSVGPEMYPQLGGGPDVEGPRGSRSFGAPTLNTRQFSSEEPRFNAAYRAMVSKAKSIRCYATWNGSFDVSPIIEADTAPAPAEMWYAQVALWVQRDVADAIAALNKQATANVQEDVYVEHSPVKRIERLRVWGYKMPGGMVEFHTLTPDAGEVPGGSFTGRSCNEQFDVVRFTLIVIVDQRELQQVIDGLTRANFYQCTNVSFAATESKSPQGYMYGTAPVIRAVLEFEGYMSRDVYAPLMPAEVRQVLGIDKNEG